MGGPSTSGFPFSCTKNRLRAGDSALRHLLNTLERLRLTILSDKSRIGLRSQAEYAIGRERWRRRTMTATLVENLDIFGTEDALGSNGG